MIGGIGCLQHDNKCWNFPIEKNTNTLLVNAGGATVENHMLWNGYMKAISWTLAALLFIVIFDALPDSIGTFERSSLLKIRTQIVQGALKSCNYESFPGIFIRNQFCWTHDYVLVAVT